ncbi:hypothetical protein QQP08_027814 [Theobroma cacao]|nr:hypothetical protein QQP08_027814 [Theobroma cacao]
MEESTTSLLEREVEYYENCPGCKTDRLKQEQTGVPYKHLSFIWIVSLCTALPISSLFPFVYFMVCYLPLIIVYCVFSLQEMAYSEIFSLWAVSDQKYGGLSFSSQDVGEVLAISEGSYSKKNINNFTYFIPRIWSVTVSTFVIPTSREDPWATYGYTPFSGNINSIAVMLSLYSYAFGGCSSFGYKLCIHFKECSICFSCYWIIHIAEQCSGTHHAHAYRSIIIPLSGISILFLFSFFDLFLSQPQSQRGAANGISITAMSVFKAFGPAGGGALFSWAQKRQVATFLPGDQMVFFVLNLVQVVGLMLTFKPFLAEPRS